MIAFGHSGLQATFKAFGEKNSEWCLACPSKHDGLQGVTSTPKLAGGHWQPVTRATAF